MLNDHRYSSPQSLEEEALALVTLSHYPTISTSNIMDKKTQDTIENQPTSPSQPTVPTIHHSDYYMQPTNMHSYVSTSCHHSNTSNYIPNKTSFHEDQMNDIKKEWSTTSYTMNEYRDKNNDYHTNTENLKPISMKSLLGNFKSSPHQSPTHAQGQIISPSQSIPVYPSEVISSSLPSFRDIFVPTSMTSTLNVYTYQSTMEQTNPSTTSPTMNENMETTGLTCKYRTGKCHNPRALKSCGDYHNLCNYHRLRANANQRKLDRKKKNKKQQSPMSSGSMSPSEVVQSNEMTDEQITPLHSVAAASALCSLPWSLGTQPSTDKSSL